MAYNQGDIVLLPYPFTDLSATKLRPVIIVSRSYLHPDYYIVTKITSVIRNDTHSCALSNRDLTINLHQASEVRTNELSTLHHSIIRRYISTLRAEPLRRLIDKIKSNF
jgi:mRNA interferase MazF